MIRDSRVVSLKDTEYKGRRRAFEHVRRRAWHVELELVGNDDTVDRNELAHGHVDDRLR